MCIRDRNNEVFATAWDCIIVDEAHEGTQTELGKAVMQLSLIHIYSKEYAGTGG